MGEEKAIAALAGAAKRAEAMNGMTVR